MSTNDELAITEVANNRLLQLHSQVDQLVGVSVVVADVQICNCSDFVQYC